MNFNLLRHTELMFIMKYINAPTSIENNINLFMHEKNFTIFFITTYMY